MSRNQKATVLTSGFYVGALTLLLWGAMLQPETRVKGTIGKKQIDIPVYLQNEPQYAGLKNTKVSPGWGGGRLLLWLAGAGCGITGLVLSNERRAELEKERILYEQECLEIDQQAQLDRAYRLSLDHQKKQRTGEAAIALHEDNLAAEVDSIREANGWIAPDRPELTRQLPPPPQLKNDVEDELGAQIDALAAAARERLAAMGEGDRCHNDRPLDNTADTRYQLYSDRGNEIVDSMVDLKMSILNVAPTGGGKTHTLDKWLMDIQELYPVCELYVIAQKNDPFMGLSAKGRVTRFDSGKPEASLHFLDVVHKELQRRKDEPLHQRQHDDIPVRLILDDWYASYLALQNYTGDYWREVKRKLSDIVTLGREVNVCLYVCTQSYVLAALGLAEDSNIRNNLAIVCQGLVKVKKNGRKQGTYQSLQQIIRNTYITPSKEDRQRLADEIQEVIELSKKHGVPAVFSAIDESTLALMPYVEITLDCQKVESNEVDLLAKFNEELTKRGMTNHSSITPEKDTTTAQKPDTEGVSKSGEVIDEVIDTENGESLGNINWETDSWYKWLPSKAEVLKLLEDTDANFYSLAYIVRSKLKKTDAEYNRKAKSAIVQLILDLDRIDLIEKYQINPKDYPLL